MLLKIKIVSFVLALSLLGIFPQRGATEELIIVQPPTVEQHIQRIFGTQARVATAVLKAESGMKLNAKNYNCFYYRNDGSKYSTSCKKDDKSKAWSVDCGFAQINVKFLELRRLPDINILTKQFEYIEENFNKINNSNTFFHRVT